MNDRLAGLVPGPRSVRALEGTLALIHRPTVIAGADRPADASAHRAVSRVLASIPWPDRNPGPGPDSATPKVTVTTTSDLGDEAYRLTISPDGINIEAGGDPGAFYAAQTLRQLLPDAAWRAAPAAATTNDAATKDTATKGTDPWHLPCAEIEDAPALAWRGGHIDVARHFFPKHELLRLIDAYAALKLNRLHLHLTDDQGWRVESHRHPRLHEVGSHRPRTRLTHSKDPNAAYDETPHGGYYTLADLAEISAYAADRMITVVPEIEVPGHASALLAALPELGAGRPPEGGYRVIPDWGIFPYLMSPLPPTMAFLGDIFGELLSAIKTPYVHIGGDECVLDSWRDDPEIDAYRQQRGLASAAELHAAFLRDVADMLAGEFGVRAVVWDEGFASTGDRPGMLRQDTIVMAWRGLEIARRAAEAGHDVVAAPVLPTYFDYYQSDLETEPGGIGGPLGVMDVAAFSPVPREWPASAQQHLIGAQFQVWTEYIRNGRELEYMIFPRAVALAEVAWTGEASMAGQPGRLPEGTELPAELAARLTAHLDRLDAAGVEYRPLAGPRPWQEGGTGPRRHRSGYRVRDVTAHLDELATAAEGT
jgi:hexosaminidase